MTSFSCAKFNARPNSKTIRCAALHTHRCDVFLIGGVDITPFVDCDADGKPVDNPLLVSLLASLLWQKDTVNVGEHTTSSNGYTA